MDKIIDHPDAFDDCKGQCGYSRWCSECMKARKKLKTKKLKGKNSENILIFDKK